MPNSRILLIFLVFVISQVSAQSPIPGKPWPSAWNATLSITVDDLVIGAPATSYYDSSRLMQVTFFTQCAQSGIINFEPCTQVQSSVRGNFGIWTIIGDSCCVNFNDVGYLSPDWPTSMKFIGYREVYGKSAIYYAGGGTAHHDYYVTSEDQVPLFSGPEEWTWVDGWVVGPQPGSIFDNIMPVSQCNATCST